MLVIRRIYVYLLTLVGLGLLAFSVAGLLRLLLESLFKGVLAERPFRTDLSQAIAGSVVGLPVWLAHWWWATRLARDPDERRGTLRRLALYLALAVSGTSLAGNLQEIVRWLAEWLRPTRPGYGVEGPGSAVVVAAVVWLYHWRVLAADRTAVGEARGSGTLRRWYLYGFTFVGFVLLLSGAQATLEALWRALAGDARLSSELPDVLPMLLVGLGVWLLHWRILPRRLPTEAQTADQRGTLRSVALFLALAIGVLGALLGLSQLLYYALGRMLGVSAPGGVAEDLLLAASGPASTAIVYGLGWLYTRATLQDRSTEAPRQVSVRRFYTYLVALAALGALAAGVGGLLWTLADAVAQRRPPRADWWQDQVALFATLAIVGLPVWAAHWRPVADAVEARALSRRLYLYLALIAAMLVLVGSAVVALYLPLTWLLGADSAATLVSDLMRALALALVAGAVAAYHVQVLRRDSRLTRDAPPMPAPAPATLLARLSADSPEALDAAIVLLRERGVRVEAGQD